MYAYVCNTITVLISCHISYLPIFFICMNNSIHWCINRYFNFSKNMVIETFKQFGDVFKICTTPRCLHYDVNFPHSSQYCKVSLKLCTKNEHLEVTGDKNIAEEFNKYFSTIGPKLGHNLPSSDINPMSYVMHRSQVFNFRNITFTEVKN